VNETHRTQLEDRDTRTDGPDTRTDGPDTRATIAWLEEEFPGWGVDVDETATWEGDLRVLWIARREGHHPQAELTPAKLHTRLAEYLEREERRRALSN
jgi:hypothetical protein